MHFFHVDAAMTWVGGGVMLSLIGLRARHTEGLAVVAAFAIHLSYAGLRVFTPAVVVVLLSRVWLVLVDAEWQLTQLWVLLALGAFATAFLFGAVNLSRSAVEPERAATAGDLDATHAATGRWPVGYALALAILVFALWDMVFKPGALV